MKKEIVINASKDRSRIAIVEDGQLAELYIENPDNVRTIGNIYLARIRKLMPQFRAAFVDVGQKQDAFLHYSDLTENLPELLAITGEAVPAAARQLAHAPQKRVADDESEPSVEDTLDLGETDADAEPDAPEPAEAPAAEAPARQSRARGRGRGARPGGGRSGRSRREEEEEEEEAPRKRLPHVIDLTRKSGRVAPPARTEAPRAPAPPAPALPAPPPAEAPAEAPTLDAPSATLAPPTAPAPSPPLPALRAPEPEAAPDLTPDAPPETAPDTAPEAAPEAEAPAPKPRARRKKAAPKASEAEASTPEAPPIAEVEAPPDARPTEAPPADEPALAAATPEASVEAPDAAPAPKPARRARGTRKKAEAAPAPAEDAADVAAPAASPTAEDAPEASAAPPAPVEAAGPTDADVEAPLVDATAEVDAEPLAADAEAFEAGTEAGDETTDEAEPAGEEGAAEGDEPRRRRRGRRGGRRHRRAGTADGADAGAEAAAPDALPLAALEGPGPEADDPTDPTDELPAPAAPPARDGGRGRGRGTRGGPAAPARADARADAEARPDEARPAPRPAAERPGPDARTPERAPAERTPTERTPSERTPAERTPALRAEPAAPAPRPPERRDGPRPAGPPMRPDDLLRRDGRILVKITKEPISAKGSRVSTDVSLAGRFLVLVPAADYVAVSKKIDSAKERRRLRTLAESLKPEGMGVIVRTVAQGREAKVLDQDLRLLVDKWRKIERTLAAKPEPPVLLYEDVSMVSSIIRDLFTDDYDRILVDDPKLHRNLKAYVQAVAPHMAERVVLHKSNVPVFRAAGIERQVEEAFSTRVSLPSGGYLFVEHTEAMHVIDVNSGRAGRGLSQSENLLRVNLEAAREVARQLRLRDLGGIIVVDFIDMYSESDRKKVYNLLKDEFRKDRAVTKLLPMSDFGIIEITRQRLRPSLTQKADAAVEASGDGAEGDDSAVRMAAVGAGEISQPERRYEPEKREEPLAPEVVAERIEAWGQHYRDNVPEKYRDRPIALVVHPLLADFLRKGSFLGLGGRLGRLKRAFRGFPFQVEEDAATEPLAFVIRDEKSGKPITSKYTPG